MKNSKNPTFTTNENSSSQNVIPSLKIDILCSPCTFNHCKQHNPSRIVTDEITGMTVEAVCVCTHRRSKT